jgi:hypothetical protein
MSPDKPVKYQGLLSGPKLKLEGMPVEVQIIFGLLNTCSLTIILQQSDKFS